MATAEYPEAEIDQDLVPPQGMACESCGAPVERGDKYCPACGTEVDGAGEGGVVDAPDEPAQKFFRCKNCGSEVATDPDQRSYTCAFCESTYVVEFSPEETGRQRPEFIIGFGITREQADEKFREWIAASRWFQPGDLDSARIVERLRGVYMPFWAFSMLAQSSWSSEIGEHWQRTERYTTVVKGKTVTRTRTVTETEWWDLAGRHHEFHNGHLLSGSRGLSQKEADRIKPFHLAALKRYEPFFLAGWLAEEYSVERDEALRRCKEVFHRWEQRSVEAFMPGDRHRNVQLNTTFSHIQSDLILLPVYVLTYRYGEKLYRFVINGQTGKVAGDKPTSRKRIAVAVGSAILGAVVLLYALVMLLRWLF